MGITISHPEARRRLDEAIEIARSDAEVPQSWYYLAQSLQEASSKTYTPALGTVLLAKATDPRVDPLSIKESYGPHTYSLRTLCHAVLVPASVEKGFSIRNTGREPMNNQPFFRYDHMSEIERVRHPETLDKFRSAVRELATLTRDEALLALAAFLRYRYEVVAHAVRYDVSEGQSDLLALVLAIQDFLGASTDRPKRLQAVSAAVLDMSHGDVRSRRLNDPSRDLPGDVQAYVDGGVILSAEVRGKRVPATEVRALVSGCRRYGIDRAFVIALDTQHDPLPRTELRDWAWQDQRVMLTVIETVEELCLPAFAQADRPLRTILSEFTDAVLRRLSEIEADEATMSRWVVLAEQSGDQRDDTD